MINIKRLFNSFINAFVGIGYAWFTQQSFRIQVISAGFAIILGYFFKLNLIEWLLIISSILGVIVAELINTAVELTVDLIIKKKIKEHS